MWTIPVPGDEGTKPGPAPTPTKAEKVAKAADKITRDLGKPAPHTIPKEVVMQLPPALAGNPELLAIFTDPKKRAAFLREGLNIECRANLYSFFKYGWKVINSAPFEDGPHIRALCDHVQKQLEERAKALADPAYQIRAQALLINVPPRCLKSSILVYATAWAWLRWPTIKIMYLSSNPRVSQNGARWFRTIITSPWFQETFRPEWKIRTDQDALSDMGNTAGGTRIARGLDSAIVGEGCDWLCVDDPHDMTDSTDQVRATLDNYDAAVANRINDPRTSLRTFIMQRYVPGDFAARILSDKNLRTLHLRLPMEYEAPDIIECECGTCVGKNVYGWSDWRTKTGEILHPRFTREFLAGEFARLRAHGYAGQMQQRPSAKEGNQFKIGMWSWFQIANEFGAGTDGVSMTRPLGSKTDPALVLRRTHDGKLEADWVEVSVDPTGGSTSDDASGWGIVIIWGKANRRFIIDRTEGPATYLQGLKYIKRAIVDAANITGRWRGIKVVVEKKALGPAAIEQLRQAVGDGTLVDRLGHPIIAVIDIYDPGSQKKEVRAEFMEPMLDSGVMYLLDGQAWVPAYVGEFAAFPKGQRDDRVDATGQCLERHQRRISWADAFKKAGR